MNMQQLVINGKNKLQGEIEISGAKNSVLALLAATVILNGKTTLTGCPELSDVYSTCQILTSLGCSCKRKGNSITVCSDDIHKSDIDHSLMMKMRSSILFMGALLARFKSRPCEVFYPGGCPLGDRPIDIHISALSKLGAVITENGGRLICKAPNGLKGADISLMFPSVGATENIILASVLAKGETNLSNCACEPEITDLCRFLNKCGAKIYGYGTPNIRIVGVEKLYGCEYKVCPDRIETATYMGCAAVTGGELILNSADTSSMTAVVPVFEQMGCKIYAREHSILIAAPGQLKPVKNIRTMPYPGFPTDAQPIVMAALATAGGTSVIVETIFPNRFGQAAELVKMGADIRIENDVAIISKSGGLYGASVKCHDLRAGASLVVLALACEGKSILSDIYHIDRGYECLEQKLNAVGGDVVRTY